MTPDDLERILSSDDSIQPSSGFTADVMAAVRREADEPPHLQFPWLRFAAGIAGSAAMAGTGAVLLMPYEPALSSITASLAPLVAIAPELGYAAAALLLSLTVAALPRLLVRS